MLQEHFWLQVEPDTGRPALASVSIDTVYASVNYEWHMGTSWLEGLFCQKVLL